MAMKHDLDGSGVDHNPVAKVIFKSSELRCHNHPIYIYRQTEQNLPAAIAALVSQPAGEERPYEHDIAKWMDVYATRNLHREASLFDVISEWKGKVLQDIRPYLEHVTSFEGEHIDVSKFGKHQNEGYLITRLYPLRRAYSTGSELRVSRGYGVGATYMDINDRRLLLSSTRIPLPYFLNEITARLIIGNHLPQPAPALLQTIVDARQQISFHEYLRLSNNSETDYRLTVATEHGLVHFHELRLQTRRPHVVNGIKISRRSAAELEPNIHSEWVEKHDHTETWMSTEWIGTGYTPNAQLSDKERMAARATRMLLGGFDLSQCYRIIERLANGPDIRIQVHKDLVELAPTILRHQATLKMQNPDKVDPNYVDRAIVKEIDR